MPEIPAIGFVIEALGAAGLALILHSFERRRSRPGVREWTFALWAQTLGLAASIATARLPFSTVNPAILALADVPYYWARALLLLGTWARWKDRRPDRLPRSLLIACATVPMLVSLLPLDPPWRSVVRASVYSLLLSPPTLMAALLLLRARRDVPGLGPRALAVSLLGLGLEDLFLTGAVVANVMHAHPPLSSTAAEQLIDLELLLLLFTGVGMVAWLLAEERETAVRLEEAVRRKEVMSAMGSLVAGVAHEVRNPLFAISSTLDALEARLGAQPAAAPALAVLRGEVRRLSALMNQLLDYGRPVEPGLVTEPLVGVLGEAVQACAPLAASAGVTLEAHRDVPEQPIAMDRPRLVQAFQNLIQNAIQHTPRGGAVLVGVKAEVRRGQPGLRCAVRDSGPGFDPRDLERVFEPFFTRRRGGTGLGLSIAQRIIREHSGDVEAANHPQGGGEVSVWLPIVPAPRTP